MSVPDDCKDCLRGYVWEGTPAGIETKLGANVTYKVGSDPEVAVLVIHDLGGWTFPNLRLLADYYAKEVGATAFVPDFFGGEVLPLDALMEGPASEAWAKLDISAFSAKNSKKIREPEIFGCVAALRSQLGFKKVVTVGYCFGGWAVFRLGSQEGAIPLVDAISTAHPSWLTKQEIAGTRVPSQIIAPEHDMQLTPELKKYANETLPTLGVEYDYRYFPGLIHAFATKGDDRIPGEKQGAARAKRAVASWFLQMLRD
ncbi:uncharacterized protein HMPREF1541_07496 [Cyphellophora europaea CBS 101466]|uniref:Dienelactone hydrolase domain-containing protein n=1 Tax=Cyphellophora europaea (strain CBS 101466) TaxID=1220924 RepID=W2RQA8_CYPE1|nr:uncharacterized protein HMPREF1541_07496 [Cyphellophora europaea CBS 101466]ETN37873.1 hypothetical protein HMPREF1541_07496 [Cyphellophora europaea CBS 101466]